MGLLPAYIEDEIQTEETEELEVPKEFGVDFSTGQLTGEVVEGKEAVRVWVYFALQIARYRYFICSWDYGNEIETLYGKSYTPEHIESEITKMLEECLLENRYIEKVEIENAEYKSGKFKAEIIITTIYKEKIKEIYETEET